MRTLLILVALCALFLSCSSMSTKELNYHRSLQAEFDKIHDEVLACHYTHHTKEMLDKADKDTNLPFGIKPKKRELDNKLFGIRVDLEINDKGLPRHINIKSDESLLEPFEKCVKSIALKLSYPQPDRVLISRGTTLKTRISVNLWPKGHKEFSDYIVQNLHAPAVKCFLDIHHLHRRYGVLEIVMERENGKLKWDIKRDDLQPNRLDLIKPCLNEQISKLNPPAFENKVIIPFNTFDQFETYKRL